MWHAICWNAPDASGFRWGAQGLSERRTRMPVTQVRSLNAADSSKFLFFLVRETQGCVGTTFDEDAKLPLDLGRALSSTHSSDVASHPTAGGHGRPSPIRPPYETRAVPVVVESGNGGRSTPPPRARKAPRTSPRKHAQRTRRRRRVHGGGIHGARAGEEGRGRRRRRTTAVASAAARAQSPAWASRADHVQ